MEEINTNEMGMDAGDDLFLDAEDFSEGEDGNQTDDTPAEDAPAEETPAEEPAQDGEEPEEGKEPSEGAEEQFDLKYMKQTKQVGRAEVIELAQKGMDYDRAVQQRNDLRNALQEQLNWRGQNEYVLTALSDLAKQSNMDVPAFVDSLKENMLVKQQGLSRDAAKERVEKDKLQRKLDAKEQSDLKNKEAAMLQTRAQKEVQAFRVKYPDVSVKDIPEDVLKRAESGDTTLLGAYTEHLNSQLKAEVEKLQAELAAEKQNKSNKQKTAGSAKTDGAGGKLDDFLSGFNA